jgi:hypothetical protein
MSIINGVKAEFGKSPAASEFAPIPGMNAEK